VLRRLSVAKVSVWAKPKNNPFCPVHRLYSHTSRKSSFSPFFGRVNEILLLFFWPTVSRGWLRLAGGQLGKTKKNLALPSPAAQAARPPFNLMQKHAETMQLQQSNTFFSRKQCFGDGDGCCKSRHANIATRSITRSPRSDCCCCTLILLALSSSCTPSYGCSQAAAMALSSRLALLRRRS
jgi:hypothetical protein